MNLSASFNGSTQLNLRFLRDLGVTEKELGALRDDLHKRDQLAVDGGGYVRFGTLESSARALSIPLPTDALKRLFTVASGANITGIKAADADFPIPSVAASGKDAALNFDSNRVLLAENGEAKISKKSSWENFFLRRTKTEDGVAGFELHGFQKQTLAIDVPKNGALVIINSKGHQVAYNVRPAEITAGMVDNKPFTVKVLGADKEVVLEQAFNFEKTPGAFSKKLLNGSFKQRAADDPIAEKPIFSVGDVKDADRVLVKRDGKSFAIDRYEQLLIPPKMTKQAFRAENGTTFEVHSQVRGSAELDDASYSWFANAKITGSDGRNITLDPTLKESRRALWTKDGLAIFDPHKEKPIAVFNPFFGEQHVPR